MGRSPENDLANSGDRIVKRALFRSTFTVCCLAAGVTMAADPPKTPKIAKESPAAKGDEAKSEKGSRISSKVDVESVAHLSDAEAREVSFATGRILKHVAQAREALAEKHMEDATRHVDQGLKLMKIIDTVLPHFKVKTQISSGDISYADEDDVTPRFVTLFEEIDRHDVISPVIKAKQDAAKKSDQVTPAKEGEAKGSVIPVVVSHADVTYTSVRLDVELARKMLTAARKELGQNKPDQADRALHSLQAGGVVFEFDEIDLPLKQAADNLKLAEIEMKDGRLEEARAALHEAIDDLKSYEERVGDNRGQEVKTLHEEITKLTVQLEGVSLPKEEVQKMTSTVNRWRANVAKWFTKKK